MTTVCPPGDC